MQNDICGGMVAQFLFGTANQAGDVSRSETASYRVEPLVAPVFRRPGVPFLTPPTLRGGVQAEDLGRSGRKAQSIGFRLDARAAAARAPSRRDALAASIRRPASSYRQS